MKKLTFCSLPDFLNGLDPLFQPVMFTTATIHVVVVQNIDRAKMVAAPVIDKSIALVAAAALTNIIATPEMQ